MFSSMMPTPQIILLEAHFFPFRENQFKFYGQQFRTVVFNPGKYVLLLFFGTPSRISFGFLPFLWRCCKDHKKRFWLLANVSTLFKGWSPWSILSKGNVKWCSSTLGICPQGGGVPGWIDLTMVPCLRGHARIHYEWWYLSQEDHTTFPFERPETNNKQQIRFEAQKTIFQGGHDNDTKNSRQCTRVQVNISKKAKQANETAQQENTFEQDYWQKCFINRLAIWDIPTWEQFYFGASFFRDR